MGALWRIVFFRAGDRIAHRIELAGDGCQAVLESAEGSADEPWPVSPALQQVHFQPTPDGRQAALLVGMAGRSHWSASVEVSADGSQAVFEVACRAKSPPARLGSSYQVLGEHAAENKVEHAVELALIRPLSQAEEHGAARVFVGPLALRSEPIAPAPPPQWEVGPDWLRLTVLPAAGTWPQTISWRYVLQARP